ncbi:Calx-beta domain protein [Gimesia panareensis]|uniref:Calx-beta domain protein n=1 Tax=Gimesia panareensis TaxID=2527978 RepID=A0A518FY28_9PLAN|nr:Calx-beta domain-containing protein [Gimesia panareensis]QDV21279.1 Calx-beta domain protein [Gimesia panareensis]
MSSAIWFSRLKQQFHHCQNRKSRLRGQWKGQHRSPAAAVLAAPNVIETLEDRTLLTALLSVDDVTASENETFTFQISLDQAAAEDVTVRVNTVTDTASDNDYTFLSNKLVTIPAGELATQVTVHVHDDESLEADETFSLVLSDPRLGGESLLSELDIADATGQGTILNDDWLPGSVFTITSEKIVEGDSDGQLLKFTITRTGSDLNFDTSVNFSTIDGTAVAGKDYTAKSEVIDFAASTYMTSQTVVVSINVQGDSLQELSETVIGRISNPTGGSVLKGNVSSLDATGIIANDDSDFNFQDSYSADPTHANHTGDSVGSAVAIDGDVMVVGAASNQIGEHSSGAAYIYVRNQQGTPSDQTDDTWDYQTFLKSPVPKEHGNFGNAVAIYSDTIVVGEMRDSSGIVYVYTRVGDDWKSETPLVEQIRVEGLSSNAYFRMSVAIYENTIVFGAHTPAFNFNPVGSAYIFEKTGIDWSAPSMRLLAHTVPDYDDYYGCAVSIHGDTIVVGAGYDDTKGTGGGAAYIYSKVGDNWITEAPLLTKLTASNGVSGDHFGLSVATNGSEILIGASSRSSNGDYSGSAYLYTRMGSDWSSIPPNEIEFHGDAESDNFGSKVSLSENQMVIGAISAREIGVITEQFMYTLKVVPNGM